MPNTCGLGEYFMSDSQIYFKWPKDPCKFVFELQMKRFSVGVYTLYNWKLMLVQWFWQNFCCLRHFPICPYKLFHHELIIKLNTSKDNIEQKYLPWYQGCRDSLLFATLIYFWELWLSWILDPSIPVLYNIM